MSCYYVDGMVVTYRGIHGLYHVRWVFRSPEDARSFARILWRAARAGQVTVRRRRHAE